MERCHFCKQDTLSSQILEEGDTYTYINCKTCGKLKVQGLFMACNNENLNSDNFYAWRDFLKDRSKEEKNQELLINSVTPSPSI